MTTPAPGRPVNSRPKTDPTCTVPDSGRHNSVRAAREGCTCPGALAAQRHDLERGRIKNRNQRAQRKRKRTKIRDIPSPIVRTRREPAGAPQPTHTASARERALRARDDLACRRHDPELWFPTGSGDTSREQELYAKRICAHCPAVQLCRLVALELAPTDGVMGGYSADDRRAIRARRWEDAA